MKNDFSKGSVVKSILNLAVPMTFAQLVNVLYNVIDRVYIGKIPNDSLLSLTGLGLALPIITIVIAFANLFGMGGAPLCSIERGKGNIEEAENIMGNSFALMIICGLALTFIGLIFKKQLLFLFGASQDTFPFADKYISIYLCGSIFVMTGLGMNSFINSQGFSKIGMATVLLGAVTNIILDPVFIFYFKMGVQGAALATVISQFLSAFWVFKFLTGKKTILRLRLSCFRLKKERVLKILGLGLSGFIMQVTNSAVQAVCNIKLQYYGGDLYVGIMTVINSIREVISMPVLGLANSSQPFIGFNYGAGIYDRVKKAIKFVSVTGIAYTLIAWLILNLFPVFFITIFNNEPELVSNAVHPLRLYYFGFFMQALQFVGQSAFVALGKSKQAIFFSLFRKVIIVIPLTIVLPLLFNLGTSGVFLAEPVSNFIGGASCFITMIFVVNKELKQEKVFTK